MRKEITIIMFLSAFTMYCQDEIKTVKNTIQIIMMVIQIDI